MAGNRTRQNRFRAKALRGGKDAREREFEQLYRESYAIVYNYVRYRMSDQAAVEDIVAEAFLLAARSFDRFDPTRAKFSTWVTTIAVNCMRSYYRKVKPMVDLADIPDSILSTSGGQDEVDDKELVLQLLDALSPEERELVVMKYRDGKRNVDIADELDMNASTVATKLAKALATMRSFASKSGIEL